MNESESIIGQIVEGSVNNIVKFGAFIKLPNGEVGLVHISEISKDFVSNIEDHLSVNESVKVKVVSRNPQGKLELSIKQIESPASL
ncbi:MAG: S1 RNA-binding domain-containing protein [bacterium]